MLGGALVVDYRRVQVKLEEAEQAALRAGAPPEHGALELELALEGLHAQRRRTGQQVHDVVAYAWGSATRLATFRDLGRRERERRAQQAAAGTASPTPGTAGVRGGPPSGTPSPPSPDQESVNLRGSLELLAKLGVPIVPQLVRS